MTLEEAIEYASSEEEPTTPTIPVLEEPLIEKPLDKLTSREEEIAVLVARGLTNRQIAEELVMSRRTVENHVGSILKKLGLRSRQQVTTSMALEAATCG